VLHCSGNVNTVDLRQTLPLYGDEPATTRHRRSAVAVLPSPLPRLTLDVTLALKPLTCVRVGRAAGKGVGGVAVRARSRSIPSPMVEGSPAGREASRIGDSAASDCLEFLEGSRLGIPRLAAVMVALCDPPCLELPTQRRLRRPRRTRVRPPRRRATPNGRSSRSTARSRPTTPAIATLADLFRQISYDVRVPKHESLAAMACPRFS
jgi:hypothetical protein